MYDLNVEEVVLDRVEGQEILCSAYLHATLEVYVRVEQEAVQIGEDKWDPGFHHGQTVYLTASVQATLL